MRLKKIVKSYLFPYHLLLGHQVGKGDEEGSGTSDPLHGGGEAIPGTSEW